MGVLHSFNILSIFNGNFIFFLFFGQLSMLFNGKFVFFYLLFNGRFAFCQFSMLFNGNLRIESFGGGEKETDGRTDGHMEIHPCVLQDIGPLGPLPKKDKGKKKKKKKKKKQEVLKR